MEEEYEAFHEILESNVRKSAKSRAKMQSEQAPVMLSELPVERVEQLVTKYVKEASDRLAVLMNLDGTVPEINLLAGVPMEDADGARPNAQVKVRRTTRRQQRRLAKARSKTNRTLQPKLQAEYFTDLRVLEQMIQQVKAEST
eukprot:1808864-Amphidinium_carterae.2